VNIRYRLEEKKTAGLWCLLACVLAVVFSGCVCHAPDNFFYVPGLLPRTTLQMKTAGFWIARHPQPDGVVLTAREIDRFNQRVRDELSLTKDLSLWPSLTPGEELRLGLQTQLEDLKGRGLVWLNGQKPSAAYWSSVDVAVNRDAVPEEIPRQYGLVVRYASQRFLPVEEGLYAKAYDADFDELQNSALDIGTPVVILRHSPDGKWLYVESAFSAGWLRAENVAQVTDEMMERVWLEPLAVITAPKADIYLNEAMTDFYGFVLMGTRLPLVEARGDYFEVLIPFRQTDGTARFEPGFIPAADVHEGYLPYTPRNILTQAFKMLNQPYGWGGMYGEQDCSRFLQEVFSTVGIELPRDSKNQIKTGEAIALWEKETAGEEKLRFLQEQAVGGITLLGMKGHIMLYLGQVEGRAYAVHAVWAYRRPSRGQDEIVVLNRVAVTDLTLGEGSRKGSLLKRLNAVRSVR